VPGVTVTVRISGFDDDALSVVFLATSVEELAAGEIVFCDGIAVVTGVDGVDDTVDVDSGLAVGSAFIGRWM
jgi:hypothetical protein